MGVGSRRVIARPRGQIRGVLLAMARVGKALRGVVLLRNRRLGPIALLMDNK